MKILWLSVNRKTRVANHFDSFRKAFSKTVDMTHIEFPSGKDVPFARAVDYVDGKLPYPHIITQHLDNVQYDAIVCDAIFIYLLEQWVDIKIPVFIIIEDQHSNTKDDKMGWKHLMVHDNIHIINKYQFRQFHKELKNHPRTHWLPHSIDINMFKDYGQEKEYGLLQTGAVYKVYKTRLLVQQMMSDSPDYKRIVRPAEHVKNQWPIREDYAKELNKAWMSLCCGAKVEYTVRKFFEIPSCKSALYTDYFDELGDLGFIPDVNMIQIDKSNIKGQVTSLLNDKNKLQTIIENGYDLIMERHTDDIRVAELKAIILETINV